ncbi:MCE family protein [Nocardioides sp. W3-2-3]|uniref:MlaD family protein n=1 Tax=Nocardioides convexus TaxID=2712224 RepID=UPI0024187F33|nr:MlaD family protein [Nocardioides convexus]NGZ99908.1 MCE family protein [Nocardioides convexus]
MSRWHGRSLATRLARRGLIALVAIAVIGAFVTLRTNGTFGSQPHVTATVANAGGSLRAGSDVKMNGVIVGKVADIRRSDDKAHVTVDMAMSSSDLKWVPGNVVARILPATVFGTTFVDLVVHGAPDGSLKAGAEVQPDASQGTLESQQALDDIDRLVDALGPAEPGLGDRLGGRGPLRSRQPDRTDRQDAQRLPGPAQPADAAGALGPAGPGHDDQGWSTTSRRTCSTPRTTSWSR